MADIVAQWSNFNVAMTGASAALAGLVIVAASVNIGKIIQAGTLTARLAAAIAALVLALVVSATGLVPGIDLFSYGLVTLVAAVGAGWFHVHATSLIMRDADSTLRARVPKSIVGLLPRRLCRSWQYDGRRPAEQLVACRRRVPPGHCIGDSSVMDRAG